MSKMQNNQLDGESKVYRKQVLFWRAILIFMFLIVIASIYVICIYTPPLVISENTTRITSPLTEDGQIDFLKYLEEKYYPPEIATDDNGFRIFVRKFNFPQDEELREYLCKKLGLDINISPTMKFPEPFITPADPHDPLATRSIGIPWKINEYPDHPEIADWVASSDKALDEIAELIRKPIFFIPYIPIKNTKPIDYIYYQRQMNAEHAFYDLVIIYRQRANYRITQGNIAGAIDDIITIYRIGRIATQRGSSFLFQLGYDNLTEFANDIPFNANPKYPVSKEDCQRLLDAINQLPLRRTIDDDLEFSRITFLSQVQATFRNGWENSLTSSPPFVFSNAAKNPWCNQNSVYYFANRAFDRAANQIKKNLYDDSSDLSDYNSQIQSPLNKLQLKLTPQGRGKIVAMTLMDIFNLDMTFSVYSNKFALNSADCLLNLKRLSLALLMYKGEHGEYPQLDWVEKIKPYLGEDFEKSLHCPACKNQTTGKTNYALILYDKLPTNQNAIQLIELDDPVTFDQAVIKVEDILAELKGVSGGVGRISKLHSEYFLHNARFSGSVRQTIPSPLSGHLQKLIKLLELKNGNEADNNYDY
jgi:hypothetical protein